jgi:peroxiredoxin
MASHAVPPRSFRGRALPAILAAVVLHLAAIPCGALEVGGKAPAFTLPALDGKESSLDELRRGGEILLDFGSIYCGGCQELLRFLEDRQGKLGERGIRVAAVNLDPVRLHKAVRAALTGLGVSYPVVLDPEEKVAKLYGVSEVPFLVHVGADGTIRGIHEGLPGNEEEGTDPFPSIPGLLKTPSSRR